MKRKHKKQLAIAAIIGGSILFCLGAYLNQTPPAELPMDHPDWFERASEIQDRDFHSWICMGLGAFAVVSAISELYRQAMKLKR